jgi:hypothetical protein
MIFGVRGPAIDAAEIAAVGHGNAQVRNLPSEFIDECHGQLDAAKNKKAQFRFGKWATIPADHDKRCRACWIHSFPNLGGSHPISELSQKQERRPPALDCLSARLRGSEKSISILRLRSNRSNASWQGRLEIRSSLVLRRAFLALELAGRPVAELLQHRERFAHPRSLQ